MPPRNRSVMDQVLEGVGEVEIVGRPAQPSAEGQKAATYNPQADYKNAYDIDLGFQSAAFGGALIAVGATADLVIQPVTPFKPKELRVPGTIAPDFEIVSMTLADRAYIDGSPIPCENYSEVSNVGLMDIGTIQTSVPLRITVRNIGAVAARFRANFRGRKVTL
jgi:hypothetical protein